MKNLDDMQAVSREGMEAATLSMAAASQGAQTIATEFADYARRSVEQSAAAFEQMTGVRSMERAMEVQANFAKSAYESFVAQAAKFNEIYTDIAKQSFKPVEDYVNKAKPKG
jgi:hypothetical protein